MTKQELFLWGVQTLLISNNGNVSKSDLNGEKRHIYSATGNYSIVQDAIYASQRIPAELTAEDAINDFCFYMFENLREENAICPHWFTRTK
ncbi:hypothetical protein [Pantoea stewartii]|uniref:hypothetical protein n=1 Tax=Pantoea stewartii TaxID=66269 RepID=UPI0033678717